MTHIGIATDSEYFDEKFASIEGNGIGIDLLLDVFGVNSGLVKVRSSRVIDVNDSAVGDYGHGADEGEASWIGCNRRVAMEL